MTRKFLTWAAASGFVLSSASIASAAEPLTLKPTSSWQVDYAEDRCRLGRQFGSGDQEVVLFLDRNGPSEYFRLTIAGKPLRMRAERGDAEVQFGPNEQDQQLSFLYGNIGNQPALLFASRARIAAPSAAELLEIKNRPDTAWASMAPISEDRKKAAKFFRIGKPLSKPVLLETGSMRAPLAALDKCIDDLLTTWGVDAEKHKSLSRWATPLQSPGKWVLRSDYPRGTVIAGQPALVNLRLSVGADGKPTACYIQATTRLKEFDNAVCSSVMTRARFTPALDALGQPVASFYQNAVRFELP